MALYWLLRCYDEMTKRNHLHCSDARCSDIMLPGLVKTGFMEEAGVLKCFVMCH